MSDFFLIVTTSYDWHDYDKAIKPLTIMCHWRIPSGLMMVFSSITVSIGSCRQASAMFGTVTTKIHG